MADLTNTRSTVHTDLTGTRRRKPKPDLDGRHFRREIAHPPLGNPFYVGCWATSLMNTLQRFALAAGLVLVAAIASVLAAPELPDQLVTNWDAAGEPNGTMSTTTGLWLIPGLAAGLLVLFALLPRIDPLRENIATFRAYYDWFVVVFIAYMTLVHAGILAFNLGYEFDFTLVILAGTVPLFYYVGVVLEQAKRNWFIGIRTPWTLSDDEVWDRTNALGATLFKLTALVTLVGLAVGYASGQGEYALYAMVVPMLLTAFGTVAYSYYLYRELDEAGASTEVGL